MTLREEGRGGSNSIEGGLGVFDSMRGGLSMEDSPKGGLGVGEELKLGGKAKVLVSRRRSLASSRSLSCKRWLLARFETCWNGNGGSNRRSSTWRTREQATNVNPVENSFFPTSITTLSSVTTLWEQYHQQVWDHGRNQTVP